MANTRYPLGLEAIMRGEVDFESDTLSIQLYSGAALYNDAHDFLNDIAGSKAGSPITLTGKDITGGKLTAAIGPFTPPAATTVVVAILYVNTGVDSTSQLLAWLDKRGDGSDLSFLSDGTALTLNWNGPIYSIGGL